MWSPTVLWTRGSGCASLAELVGGDQAHKASGDLRTACLEVRADLLIARSLSSFDLVDVAVPHHFKPDRVTSVIAAVSGGPHSSLATRIAGAVAERLGVAGRIVTASATPDDDAQAEAILADLDLERYSMTCDVVRAGTAKGIVDTFSPGTLLVLGAPGGSWMQRQFFGPGRKLLYSASGGAVVVRSAPRRCFQAAGPVAPLGTRMRVRDAELIIDGRPAVPVAEDGQLVGIVRTEMLQACSDDTTIGEVMEEPVFLHVDDVAEDSEHVAQFLGGGAVPVVDRGGNLFGEIVYAHPRSGDQAGDMPRDEFSSEF